MNTRPFAGRSRRLATAFGLSLLGLSALAGCYEREHQKPAQPAEASILPYSAMTTRQALITKLARNIQFYHRFDGQIDGVPPDVAVYSFSHGPGRKITMYRGRAAVRAELNRMLDSLRATGPLQMGNEDEGTDTLPSRRPHRSTSVTTDPD